MAYIKNRKTIYEIFCEIGNVKYDENAPNVQEAIDNVIESGGLEVIIRDYNTMKNERKLKLGSDNESIALKCSAFLWSKHE